MSRYNGAMSNTDWIAPMSEAIREMREARGPSNWYAAAAKFNAAYESRAKWQETLPKYETGAGSVATHTCIPSLSNEEYFWVDFIGYAEGI